MARAERFRLIVLLALSVSASRTLSPWCAGSCVIMACDGSCRVAQATGMLPALPTLQTQRRRSCLQRCRLSRLLCFYFCRCRSVSPSLSLAISPSTPPLSLLSLSVPACPSAPLSRAYVRAFFLFTLSPPPPSSRTRKGDRSASFPPPSGPPPWVLEGVGTPREGGESEREQERETRRHALKGADTPGHPVDAPSAHRRQGARWAGRASWSSSCCAPAIPFCRTRYRRPPAGRTREMGRGAGLVSTCLTIVTDLYWEGGWCGMRRGRGGSARL